MTEQNGSQGNGGGLKDNSVPFGKSLPFSIVKPIGPGVANPVAQEPVQTPQAGQGSQSSEGGQSQSGASESGKD